MKTKLTAIVLMLSVLMILTSCATTIRATIPRPAELDLQGASSISVLPVQVSDNSIFQDVFVIGDFIGFINDVRYQSNGARDAADYLTCHLEQGISSSGYLDLIYSSAVKNTISAGKTAPCDVYLTGTISKYNNDVKTVKRTIKENNQKKEVEYYYRDVSFVFTYQIIDSETNRVITVRSTTVHASSSEEKKILFLPDALSTIRKELDDTVSQIMKQIQPYTEVKVLSLLKDKTKDPDMKDANKMVKDNLLEPARQKYLTLYQTRGYFEAGYNAAIILEAQGKFDEAYEEMQNLVVQFGDKRAISALSDIRYEINSRNTLKEQLESR